LLPSGYSIYSHPTLQIRVHLRRHRPLSVTPSSSSGNADWSIVATDRLEKER
jgi:hypothetical protein